MTFQVPSNPKYYDSMKKHVYEWLGWPDNKAPLHSVWYLAPPSRQLCQGLALVPGSHDSAPDLCDLPTRGTDLLPSCTQCLACSGCGPHLEQRETKHSTCKDAFFNQPCEFVIHKYHFILGKIITNFLEAIACPQRHRICFSEGEILAISLEPCKRKPYRSGWAGMRAMPVPTGIWHFWGWVSRQACFHFPHLKFVFFLSGNQCHCKAPWLHSTHTGSSHASPGALSCPSPFSNVLAAALLLFCWLIPPSAQRLGPFSGRVPVSHCSQPRPQHSHCLWKSSQSFQTKVPRAG